ncbi:auxin transport protein BIG [Dorcoceras hygrometricum]|uniref:Auxin transport protein BIG n=1 Tax=Dorcoceras hygrometricum TaxID=472368 RepID=A0A2Z7CQD4_9LAMI|nr:auxin transport protein BIG [Dorcoceras hygrometricum]
MASSLFINTVHVRFESVLAMDDQGMVSMFESLMATGLKGFLGCPAVIHEAELLEFFANGSVRDGFVVKIPKDLVFDTRSTVLLSGEPVSTSGKKKEMNIEFRLLYDIFAAIPIQIIEPISAAPVLEPSMEEQREATSAVPIDEDISAVEQPADVETIVEEFDEPAVEVTTEEIRPPSTDDVDDIIEQVLAETTHIEADEEDHGVEPSVEEQREAISAVPIDEDISAVEQPADVETIVEEFYEPAVEVTAEEIRPPSTDDVDDIIQQVLVETSQLEATETDDGEHPHGTKVGETVVGA